MKETAIITAVFLLSTSSAALAQYGVPSPKAVADGAKEGSTDAANAQVEGAKDAAAAKAAKTAAPVTKKADQAKAAADSAKQTGDAVKALGTIGK